MGEALNKFREANLLNLKNDFYYPVIVLISNGEVSHTNSESYLIHRLEKELEIIKKERYFNMAIKVSIALGKGVNRDLLQEFSSNNIVHLPHSINMFKRIIKYAIIPRGINPECYADEDDAECLYEPRLNWRWDFFSDRWNKIYYNDEENFIANDIEIYRKRFEDFEIWWEEVKYNPMLEECIIYKTNIIKNPNINKNLEKPIILPEIF
jgi:hypothetical protein